MTQESFLQILKTHDALGEIFFRHQVAVLAQDFAAAHDLLCEYRRQLLDHMKDEEEGLLPVYEREPALPNGRVDFFIHEHRQMLEFLEEIRTLLATAAAAAGTARQRATLALLDKETQFKNFGEHHELREERWLFPTLDRIATPEERATLLARCLR